MNISIQQMLCLDAVVTQGSIQSAAKSLNRTHPTLITSLKKLEQQLQFSLFDRSTYRLTLTTQGKALYRSIKNILNDIEHLKTQAKHLSIGEEPELNIVLGDITPTVDSLSILRSFSEQNTFTKLNLLFENLHGPIERLHNSEADLIIHYIDKADPRYEYKDFCKVLIVPVVAKKFLNCKITKQLKYSDLNNYTQCIIRGTEKQQNNKNYFVNENSQHITVGDQFTKKQVILQRMAWGHMPLFLVEQELKNGELISIASDQIRENLIDIVVARLSNRTFGTKLEQLWQYF